MKLAAIDIGSNAIKLQVVRVIHDEDMTYLKRIGYVRFPLRLGKDVFERSFLTRDTEEKFVRLMGAFRTMMTLYDADEYLACATSAMREATNGKEVVKRVYYRHGLYLKIIDGEEEADLLSLALTPYVGDSNVVHIDVGGGVVQN